MRAHAAAGTLQPGYPKIGDVLTIGIGQSMGGCMTIVPHWCRRDLVRANSREQARRILGWEPDGTYLLSVRRHAPRYGLDVAIQAVHFCIVFSFLLCRVRACTKRRMQES